jgi:hypothetical protein
MNKLLTLNLFSRHTSILDCKSCLFFSKRSIKTSKNERSSSTLSRINPCLRAYNRPLNDKNVYLLKCGNRFSRLITPVTDTRIIGFVIIGNLQVWFYTFQVSGQINGQRNSHDCIQILIGPTASRIVSKLT